MSNRTNGLYEFGTYRLDVAKRLLTRGGEAVTLAPKTFDLLRLLAESQGRLLTKQELIKALWPDTFVEEANLSFQLSTLRKAMGEEGTPWIESVPKHGYRFTATVTDVPLPGVPEKDFEGVKNRWYTTTIAVVGIVIVLYFARRAERVPRVDLTGKSGGLVVAPLTAYPGFERNPSLSPDGSQVAFSWNGRNEDNYDIYVKLVGPGEPVRLTTDPAQDERPAWSPDGRVIAFLRRSGSNDASIFLIPALGGGIERKLIDLHTVFRIGVPSADLCWTPDGKWLAIGGNFAEGESHGLWLISIENGERRRLTTPPRGWTGDFAPAFSPDGRYLAFVRVKSFAVRDIYAIPLNAGYMPSGEPAQWTFEGRSVEGPAWTPAGKELVYSSGGHLGTRRLKRISVDTAASGRASEAQFVAVGEQAIAVSLSHNGRLVYERETRDSNVWKLELPVSEAATSKPIRLLSSTLDDYSPDYSPDGGRIAFASTRSGTEEIWIASASGSNPAQLTTMGGPPTSNPRWSPDGRTILFDSRRDGSPHLYLINPSTASWRRLTDDQANAVQAKWSRDGRWIYFSSDRTGRFEIWKRPAAGGPATQLTKYGGLAACESPDGKWVYYSKGLDSPTSIWKVPALGGEETQVVEGLSYSLNFVVARKGIYFIAIRSAQGDRTSVDFFDFATGKTVTLHRLDKSWWYGMALSPDQRSILYSVVDNAGSNLMLVEDFH